MLKLSLSALVLSSIVACGTPVSIFDPPSASNGSADSTSRPSPSPSPAEATSAPAGVVRNAVPVTAADSACAAAVAFEVNGGQRRVASDPIELVALITGTWVRCDSPASGNDTTSNGRALTVRDWAWTVSSVVSGAVTPTQSPDAIATEDASDFLLSDGSGSEQVRWAVFNPDGTTMITGSPAWGSTEYVYVLVR